MRSEFDLKTLAADVMAAHGMQPLDPRDLRTDGVICRFPCEGDKPDRKNGWCVVFPGARAVAVFGHWSKALGPITKVLGDAAHGLTPREAEAARVAEAQAKRMRDNELQRRHVAAKNRAQREWNQAKPASALHPYLARKALKPHCLREAYGDLLVPMVDIDGTLWTIQRIRADGNKRFPYGSRIKELFCQIGGEPDATILICEGWATGAALHEATGLTVYCAMTAGNLRNVARVIRQRFPDADVVLCADNDFATEQRTGNNPGLAAAESAAAAIGGRVAVPPDGTNDFADYFAKEVR